MKLRLIMKLRLNLSWATVLWLAMTLLSVEAEARRQRSGHRARPRPRAAAPAPTPAGGAKTVGWRSSESRRWASPPPTPSRPMLGRWAREMPVLLITTSKAKLAPAVQASLGEIAAARQRSRLLSWIFRGSTLAIVVIGFVVDGVLGRRARTRFRAARAQAKAEGLDVPASLHPKIDDRRCIGCGTCVKGCHGGVFTLDGGRSRALMAANCVGCGQCEALCPVAGIRLVFGTAERGVELPQLAASGETNVPGLYIAGELGGMGLIANAFEQARRVVDSIKDDLANRGRLAAAESQALDVLVVGAGPAGMGAALRAHELGLSYACLEQEEWGGAVRHYPRGKLVMTRPIRVPLYGPVKVNETTKECLLELWEEILHKTKLQVSSRVRVDNVQRQGQVFRVETTNGPQFARRVILATGMAGIPRRLNVPGEAECNVAYRMLDPEPWTGRRIAVVGGGDVACETAVALAQQPHTPVTLIYHGEKLTRPKPGNRARVEAAVRDRALELVLAAKVERIEPRQILVSVRGTQRAVAAEQVFVCAGGVPPGDFLRRLGVATVMKHGEA